MESGENKKKNVGVEGRNRKVLGDIGNLVINPVDPHANEPKRITRFGFYISFIKVQFFLQFV